MMPLFRLSLILLLGLGGEEDGIRWVDDYGEGRRIARESGRPILVVFR